jgi:hypothetical protein
MAEALNFFCQMHSLALRGLSNICVTSVKQQRGSRSISRWRLQLGTSSPLLPATP